MAARIHDAPAEVARDGSLRVLMAAYGVSALGTATSRTALPLVVLAVTGSAVRVGVAAFAVETATVASRVLAGGVVDRSPLRAVMLGGDLARAGASALLAVLLWTGAGGFWPLVVLPAVVAVLGAFVEPAMLQAVALAVPSASAGRALGLNEARNRACEVIGPPLAGGLLAAGAAAPFAADAASYLLCFGALRRLPLPDRRAGGSPGPFLGSLRTGLSFVRSRPLLCWLLGYAAVLQAGFAVLVLAFVITARQRGSDPVEIGLVFAAGALGGLAGALRAGRRALAASFPRVIGGFAAATAAWSLTLAVAAPLPLIAAVLALAQFVGVPATGRVIASIIGETPEDLQGRVLSTALLASTLATPVAPLLAGTGTAALPPSLFFTALAALHLLLVAGLALPRARSVLAPPSPDPGPVPQ